MAGILGYLSILSDDISTLAGKTIVTASKSLATSLDDVGILFDDIVTYTKLAGIKSSGILVDDLAAISSFTNETTSDILKNELKKAHNVKELKQNIEKLEKKSKDEVLKELENIKKQAIRKAQKNAAARELPIVYKIAKGSLLNKLIIIPIVLIISAIAPWLMSPALILGGIYLCFEGVESILEKLHKNNHIEEKIDNSSLSNEKIEEAKIKSAIKTDFILSFEIIVITLSLLSDSDFITKLSVLIIIGILTTIAVYGIVALIIRLDDIGFFLQEKKSFSLKKVGDVLVNSMPIIIKTISIIGTVAMLAVGGGIISHETHALSFLEKIFNSSLINFIIEIIFGLIIGYLSVKILPFFGNILKKLKTN